MMRQFIRGIAVITAILFFVGLIAGGLGATYFYLRMTRDLPQIEKLSDYRPKAVTSILADDGTLIGELYDERRYPVPFNEIPDLVKKAFLSAEDSSFYSHPGVDFISIARAMWKNFRSSDVKQGASTITQQIVKSLLLNREKTLERKTKEIILSYKIEKALTKDEIFSIYLNEIFLGAGSYGVKAAARIQFHKELPQLTIAETAYLAGLLPAPGKYSNPKNRKLAIERQSYVLNQMLNNGIITKDEYDSAKKEKIIIYTQDQQTIFHAPYFTSHVMRTLPDLMTKINPELSVTNPGGYVVETTGNIKTYNLAERALKRSLRELDKRRGWRGVVSEDNISSAVAEVPDGKLIEEEVYLADVVDVEKGTGKVTVKVGDLSGTVNLKEATWARRFLTSKDEVTSTVPEQAVKKGTKIYVSLKPKSDDPAKEQIKEKSEKIENKLDFILDQIPEVEGAFAVNNVRSGEVKAIVGGYDYRGNQFNRATQGFLQPGSSFKPFIYLAAVEHLNFTPTTIVPDSPISLIAGDGKLWSPQNFDHKFLGPIPLRTALERSRNVVSVYLVERLGVERVIRSAKRMGISTPIQENMSIALGTSEVHLIEMVRGYGAFATEGWLADQLIIKRIKDRDGQVIYEQTPRQKKVIENSADAFVMANMMKGVVERGTATVLKVLNRPVAGKTGTTNEHMDAWFIGYTPDWAAGVWVGFDQKKNLGKMETGGKAAAPVFLYFMQEFLKDTPPIDFDVPEGVTPVPISLETRRVVSPKSPGVFWEYFKTGTEPSEDSEEDDSGETVVEKSDTEDEVVEE